MTNKDAAYKCCFYIINPDWLDVISLVILFLCQFWECAKLHCQKQYNFLTYENTTAWLSNLACALN